MRSRSKSILAGKIVIATRGREFSSGSVFCGFLFSEAADVCVTAGIVAPVTPESSGRGARTGRVLPLGLRWQAIRALRLGAEPGHVSLGIIPTDADHRMALRLRKARVLPGAADQEPPLEFSQLDDRLRLPATIPRRVTGFPYEGRKLLDRHVELADREALPDRDG